MRASMRPSWRRERMRPHEVKSRVVATIAFAVALAVLWVVPILLFPHPATNEAIELSGLELPLLFLSLLGVIVAMVVFRGSSATVVRVGLGVFLLGVATDFVLGLMVFGNLQDDRFMPLLFLPPPIGLVGLLTVVVGLAGRGRSRGDILRGGSVGLAGAALVGV